MEGQRFRPSSTRRILLGMLVGGVIGLLLMRYAPVPPPPAQAPVLTQAVSLIAGVFLRLLKMLLVPLILGAMVSGVAGLGDVRSIGRLGMHTLLLYTVLLLAAVVTGQALAHVIRPGAGLHLASRTALPGPAAPAQEPQTLAGLLLRVVPENVVQALATLDTVGIIFFAIFLGLALLTVGEPQAAPLVGLFASLNAAARCMTWFVMRVAPIGMGALVADLLARQTPEHLAATLPGLGLYTLTVLLGLALQLAFYLFLAGTLGGANPVRFARQMGPALTTALGTASSTATLPVTLHCVEHAGISHRIAGFVAPIGSTANMSGTALYEAAAAVFIAQAYGIHLAPGAQVTLGITAIFAALGSAGTPCAGLVMLPIVLTSVGLPLQGIALVAAVDRLLDAFRTAVNVMGTAVACRLVQTRNPSL